MQKEKIGEDNSLQGFIDEDILALIKKINSSKLYKTTSSCSGRIVLLKNVENKLKAEWVFKSHKPAKTNDLWNVLQKTKGKIWFLQEPLIIHVKCKNLESAQKLLNLANKAGIKIFRDKISKNIHS